MMGILIKWCAFPFQTLMERRIRPWINKKIIEYIGEEEATLVDFVCSKVNIILQIHLFNCLGFAFKLKK